MPFVKNVCANPICSVPAVEGGIFCAEHSAKLPDAVTVSPPCIVLGCELPAQFGSPMCIAHYQSWLNRLIKENEYKGSLFNITNQGIIHDPPPQQQKSDPAARYDANKLRYDLIPPDALAALAEVYTKGAAKYSDRNWEKGMTWGRCFGSLMRHCWAWWGGKTYDNGPGGTGCHHMALAAWNCFALFTYEHRKIGTDDRSKCT